MNGAHLHLILNHVPVIGTVGCLLLLGIARVRGSEELTRLGLELFVLVAVLGVVVYLTGESAEEIVEDMAGVSENLIEAHQEMALSATIALGIFGAGAAGVLLRFRGRALPRSIATAAFLLAFVPAGLMAVTANRGGQLRHPEIRGDEAGVAIEKDALLTWRSGTLPPALEGAGEVANLRS